MNDERVDAENAQDAVDLFIGKITGQFAGFAQKVDQRLTSFSRIVVQLVVVVHEQAHQVVNLGVVVLEQQDP